MRHGDVTEEPLLGTKRIRWYGTKAGRLLAPNRAEPRGMSWQSTACYQAAAYVLNIQLEMVLL